jgi:uncharacterized protein
MMEKQSYTFSKNGRIFTMDLKSLVLREVFKQGFLKLHKHYRPVSLNLTFNRDLEGERNQWMLRNLNRTYCFLNISHECNMNCIYCFAKGGSYGQKSDLMNIEKAKESIDWLINSSSCKHMVINFFGGEPLMSLSTLVNSISYARDKCQGENKTLSIYVSTNGTIDFTTIASSLKNITHLFVVSLDGTSSFHNLNRPMNNGNSSYDLIIRNIENYIDKFGSSNLYVRATWRRKQSDLVSSVCDIIKLGVKNITIGRETSFNKDDSIFLDRNTNSDWEEIIDAYSSLSEWYVNELNKGKAYVIQPIYSIIFSILNSTFFRYRCSAGYNKWCIEPSGDIYACHRFIGSEKHVIGQVDSAKNILNADQYLKESALPIYCKDCWIRYWCFSGNCTYLSSIESEFNNIDGFCSSMKEFIKSMCIHISNLTDEGINTFMSISKLNSSVK